jgi:Tol biopolymer transport system component
LALEIGQELGSYRIASLVGKGGMGEVYRAHDSKLKRDVAIKILPGELARDPDRVSRFQREAEALAALNHPNIAAIYDLQQSGATSFLVLEFVEGDTLAELLATRGALPLDEASAIATQVCEALEAAHDKGIVHRDLKPANVKVMADGRVKVLDFGLAKALEPSLGASGQGQTYANSPTLSVAATHAGVILGTAPYMSPEQARGRPVDRRADVFAFGCVLYEMLTGRRAFEGDDVPDILGAVLKSEPDLDRLPAATPASVARLLRRALRKDPRQRLGDIRDARIELEEANAETPAVRTPVRRARLATAMALAIAVALIAALAFPAVRHLVEAPPGEMRLDIATPSSPQPLEFALSPDGRSIAFVASGDGPQRLWLRSLDRVDAQPIAGTDGARFPFWSADGRSIGFFASVGLYRVDVGGGPPQFLAGAGAPRGGAWNADGIILFAPSTGPIMRIAASGGEPMPVTRLDLPRQNSHRFPQFLPDGRHFLFFSQGFGEATGIYLASIDGGEPARLTAADSGGAPLGPDRIAFLRQGALVTQALDVGRRQLTGDPVVLADSVGFDGFAFFSGFSVSADGRVAYRRAGAGNMQLTWVDRTGKTIGTAGDPSATTLYPELSPDGRRVALDRTVQANRDVWLLDLVRGGMARFTFDAAQDTNPVWSPDGRIAFGSNRNGTFNPYVAPSSAPGTEQALLETPGIKVVQDWSPDGRFLLFYAVDPKTLSRDLWSLDLTGKERTTRPVAQTRFEETMAQFSPDGRWVAYQTNESNRFEIVVQPFPNPGGVKWQVSTGGGVAPRWRHDGRELYFIAPDGMLMAVPVANTGVVFEYGTPTALFQSRIAGGGSVGVNKPNYDVSRDGRFLVVQPVEESSAFPITLILNWGPPAGK